MAKGMRLVPIGDQAGVVAQRINVVLALVFTVVAVFFHWVFSTHSGALWRDEVNSVNLAMMTSLGDLWNGLRYDSFPLLSFVVIRAWYLAGWAGDDGLRLLGLLIGLCLLGTLWYCAKWTGTGAPLVSTAIFALDPWVLRVGDSIRPYGLGMILVVATLGLVAKVVLSPDRRWVVSAMGAAVLSVQCLYQNAVLILAICSGGVVAAIFMQDVRRSLIVLCIGAVSAVSLLPYVQTIRFASEWAILNQMPLHFGDIVRGLEEALGGSGSLSLFAWFGVTTVGLVLLTLRALKPIDHHTGDRGIVVYALSVTVFSVVLFLGALLVLGVSPAPRYYLLLMGVVAVCLDVAFARIPSVLRPRLAKGSVLVALLLVAAWNVQRDREIVPIRQTNIDVAASSLSRLVAEDDLIIVSPWYLGISFGRYYSGVAQLMSIPPLDDLTIHRYDLLKTRMTSSDPIGPLLSRIEETLRAGHGVWLVGDLMSPQQGRQLPQLPIAPRAASGWNSRPYVIGWMMQTGQYLLSHATSGARVKLPSANRVSDYESVSVWVLRGWR